MEILRSRRGRGDFGQRSVIENVYAGLYECSDPRDAARRREQERIRMHGAE